jgi:hypothetical protein
MPAAVIGSPEQGAEIHHLFFDPGSRSLGPGLAK